MVLTCKGCEERKVGCHSTCEKYLKAKARHELAKKLRQNRDKEYPRHTATKIDYIDGR